MNDIVLYRDLMARGVSEYLVAPFTVLDFIRAISKLYTSHGADPVGKVVAFVGAKGGVGASTLAHNVAWSIPRDFEIQTALVDLDLGFGTAGLDFNLDPPQGIAEAVFAPDRVDSNLIDRYCPAAAISLASWLRLPHSTACTIFPKPLSIRSLTSSGLRRPASSSTFRTAGRLGCGG